MARILQYICSLVFLTLAVAQTCGSTCTRSSDCISASNTCTFCQTGKCVAMCGVGCRSAEDCAGGANPCTNCSDRFVCTQPASNVDCGSLCSTDADCTQNYYNKCTFCENGRCSSMCGVGCRTSADCQGASNPCSVCNSKKVCANPAPLCGSFCGSTDLACRINGSSTAKCAGTDGSCCTCDPKDGCSPSKSKCGTVCSGQFECAGDPSCPECVGFYCGQKSTCGQVCVSSGQCQMNPSPCRACIGAVCSNWHSCGGSCGGDDWCSPSCPVCGFAKCEKSEAWEQQQASVAPENLAAFLAEAEKARAAVRTAVARR
eukprot:TRINITY_DN83283_c0_g1_i1.p1 TRINITY_DN83283_c0_g1~~TRINITY_DN83283_c0_g1_i1.p1  ORF type:complete len:316 (-),score=13.11 TRINITY_DN83283_c0_g1_i1:10-957(-)